MRPVSWDEAAALLTAGGVGVIPTDTVYVIVARAHDMRAVARLYALKRHERKPGTLIASSAEQLVSLGLDRASIAAVERWWPNPISFIIPAGKTLDYLHQGVGSIAARIPGERPIRLLAERTGPLMTSSANQPGEPVAESAADAEKYFGNGVDFYVDGGDLRGRAPSTVARVMKDGSFEIVRAGALRLPAGE